MATDRLTIILGLPERAFKVLHIMAELDRPVSQAELAGLIGCTSYTLSPTMAALESPEHRFIVDGHKRFVLTQYAKSFIFPSKNEGSDSPKGPPLKDKGKPNMDEQENSSSSAPLLNLLRADFPSKITRGTQETKDFPSKIEGNGNGASDFPSKIEGNGNGASDFPSKIEGVLEVSLGEYDPDLRIKQKSYVCEMLGLYGKHKEELVADESISPSEIFAQYYLWSQTNIKREKDGIAPLRLGVVSKSCFEHRRSNDKAKEYARLRMKRDVAFLCVQCNETIVLPVTICQEPNSIVQHCPECQMSVIMVDDGSNGLMPTPSEEKNKIQHAEAMRDAQYHHVAE